METLCAHIKAAKLRAKPENPVCQSCLDEGLRWVQLRQCLECGHVGCCDSSPGKHATKHFHASQHPVMQNAEPNGPQWAWCYVDEQMVRAPWAGAETEG